ncbi:endogenous retrovirus group K member 10 Gag polyprotein-like [Myotis daubentonii]|uniref:endogenous retrovirus group K member 10 Gag polyprotein-like n=1 Tax=Myotis daubentonii TaxID=98922 RepID=UPI0028738CD2|nr:endogenous retrovirus group K member 10 Gag polyprotein-like [Myotis daubentonii]
MLAGEGIYRDTDQQIHFAPGVYAQTNTEALKAWRKLPSSGRQTEDLSKIRQGPEEPFQDFVSRLLQAAGRLIGDGESGMLLVKQLAYENANSACQAAIRPFRKKSSLSDYVRLCSDIGPSYVQGLAIAAALQGKSVKEVLFQQQKSTGQRTAGPPGSCYRCGQLGHQVKQCPKKQDGSKQSGTCPRCKRGKHWANECRSKKDSQGNPLPPMQRNGKRGQPQAPQQCYGALQSKPSLQQGNPFRNYTGQPQEAQDWTSGPPPTQY